MSKSTKKLSAKVIRPGMQVSLPAQVVTVRMKHRVADNIPTVNDNLLLLEVTGDKGPFKGKKTELTCFEGDTLDVVLKNPPLRRVFEWIRSKLWVARAK